MNYKQIISDAWAETQKDKSMIFWFGFVPALFTTPVSIGYIVYQYFAFRTSPIFNSGSHESFLVVMAKFIWNFLVLHVDWTLPIVLGAALFFVFYFLYPTFARAAAIQVIARRKNGQSATTATGVKNAFFAFLPLFEYHLLINTFSFFAILIEISFVLNNLGLEIFFMLLPVFIIILVFSLFLTLFFTFADFYIVVDKLKIFDSMRKSIHLVFLNWKYTFLITVLMIVIGIRIILQAVIIFLIPFLVLLLAGFVASVTLQITGLIVGVAVGVIGLFIAAYLNGIVDIFSYTVWTHTFLLLSQEKELSARDPVKTSE